MRLHETIKIAVFSGVLIIAGCSGSSEPVNVFNDQDELDNDTNTGNDSSDSDSESNTDNSNTIDNGDAISAEMSEYVGIYAMSSMNLRITPRDDRQDTRDTGTFYNTEDAALTLNLNADGSFTVDGSYSLVTLNISILGGAITSDMRTVSSAEENMNGRWKIENGEMLINNDRIFANLLSEEIGVADPEFFNLNSVSLTGNSIAFTLDAFSANSNVTEDVVFAPSGGATFKF